MKAESLLRGLLPGLSGDEGSRLPAVSRAKLTSDTVWAARVPAGVHLAFAGTASAVELDVEWGPRTWVPAPTLPEAFVARAGGGQPIIVPAPETDSIVRIPLPERDPAATVRLYLPEYRECTVRSVAAIGGEVVPVERGPLWVVYGDSISQGWSVTEPGLAWPSLVAERLGLDLVNLGFAGAARGELLVADAVGNSGADAVAIAWGTNAWSSLPTDARSIAETMRLFLTTVRQGLPQAPIVVISPIIRPDAEATANRFGTTHAQLRAALEAATTEFAAVSGDERITLVPGADLVPAAELFDGIHPDDAGHARLATGVADAVAIGLGQIEPAASRPA